MIEYIKGKITGLTPTEAVLETAAGVAYLLNITVTGFTKINEQGGENIILYVHEVIREDAFSLFGFYDRNERELFRQLIGVSGVGASIARMILSSIEPEELRQVIVSGDVRRLKSVKGIGAKTAERIIVNLKDKIKGVDSPLIQKVATSAEVFEEALSALVMLGFPKPQSQKVLNKLFDAEPTLKVEAAIKKALSMM